MKLNNNLSLLLKEKKYKECILEFEKLIKEIITNYLIKNKIEFRENKNLLYLYDKLSFNFPKTKGICKYGYDLFLSEDIPSLEILDKYINLYQMLQKNLT